MFQEEIENRLSPLTVKDIQKDNRGPVVTIEHPVTEDQLHRFIADKPFDVETVLEHSDEPTMARLRPNSVLVEPDVDF